MPFESAGYVVKMILYVTLGLISLFLIVGVYTRTFRKRKLQLVNNLELITSRENIFSKPSQFLIVTTKPRDVVLKILDRDEKELGVLYEENDLVGEMPVNFDTNSYDEGIYFLTLTSEDTKIMRRIKIVK